MALVLKAGFTWTDPFGTIHDIATACPFEVTGSGCRAYETLKVGIWKDIISRDAGNAPWQVYYYYVEGVEFTTYFSKPVLNELNKNPYSQTGQWLLNCSGDFDDWEVDV